jgi:ERCC4-type nuclease
MKPTIVIDTREQKAYSFDVERAESIRAALPAGDYSLAGLEAAVAVERKSLDDFVSTVIHARKRFMAELNRLARYDAACVVVEGSMADVLARRYTCGAHPSSVIGSAISIIVDFGVPVFFCSNRQIARMFTQEFLLRFHERGRS